MLDGRPSQRLDLALAPTRFPCTLEKWYVDVLLEDGTIVLIYFGQLALLGARWARATAEVFFADGRVVRGSAAVEAASGRGAELRFGDSGISGDRLFIAAGELRGTLCYHPRATPADLRRPFLSVGTRRLDWTVEIPDADVEGELSWPGGRLEVRGRGYRDRVFFDLPPWRFPISTLHWGRAVAGEHAAFWVHAELGRGDAGPPLTHSWVDGQEVTALPMALPTGLTLGTPRTLLDVHVGEIEGLRLGPARALLRRLTGDPHEIKHAAPCTIFGAPGRAIHEVVTWQQS